MTDPQNGACADDIVYCIDRADCLDYVNEAWDRLAADNAGAAVVSSRVIGRNLWDFVSDTQTCLLYRSIRARARGWPPRSSFVVIRRNTSVRLRCRSSASRGIAWNFART